MSERKRARPADEVPFSLVDPNRLDALARSGLMDSRAEEVFDRATRLASQITGRPVALLSLVDDTRQYFKAQVGLQGYAADDRETPLSHSFCQHVVNQNAPLNVRDARLDPRVKDNGAIEDLNVIAYYGVPVRDADGFVLGSFCAIDDQPHEWTEKEIAALHDLGAIVETELRLQHTLKENQMLVGELNHRIKNIFTVTSSLVRMTARSTGNTAEMAEVLTERLRALDAAQSLAIVQTQQDATAQAGVKLTELFSTVMKPYDARRIRVDGDELFVSPSAATAFSLIFHELATNAIKYGALSDATGQLSVSHQVQDDVLSLSWFETGVDAAKIPMDIPKDGFGSRLININLQHELSGSMTRTFQDDGLRIEMRVPLSSVQP